MAENLKAFRECFNPEGEFTFMFSQMVRQIRSPCVSLFDCPTDEEGPQGGDSKDIKTVNYINAYVLLRFSAQTTELFPVNRKLESIFEFHQFLYSFIAFNMYTNTHILPLIILFYVFIK